MKVLVVHNAYQQRGGEDTVVEAEMELMRVHGHEVFEYRRDNHELGSMTRVAAAKDTLWSSRTIDDLTALIAAQKPDLLHAHNTFPLVSPSMYWAASRQGVPVIQTLHNFRLLCPQAMLLRDGSVCEQCVGRTPLAGILHACYRGSRTQTTVLASMLLLHRAMGTWTNKVACYIALNEFCRKKFIEGGLPASRIVVKSNFVDFQDSPAFDRTGFLFVGRLSSEKGLAVMARAAGMVPGGHIAVAGTGPDQAMLEGVRGISLLGQLSTGDVYGQMARAIALVFPSIWYETFGLSIVESFASRTPVIASRIGVVPDLVTDGVTGLLFEPGNPHDLAEKLRWALENPERMASMGRNARATYEAKYAADQNYKRLIEIYEHVLASHSLMEKELRDK